ncbi:RimJ/RimL family protein N-acetyltransferase [Clavibacter sp. B3I6]|jgi:RimJ/RimL family protein N-acetyltransferase|uniref:GNAT family N-acetyltransferase n=1 Tax=Clavibacter sp. B3I6 TaxID=3042268 RepID=UPI00278AED2D|nr:GNAT family N-acetyltransferase [Clavibacter sp. B3I6]MDQ0744759.1 RimJ/RimL family protein N-acetyltransferase [Clavibacter sp. B3I6]
MGLSGARVTLDRITPELARRIVDRAEEAGDDWDAEYPLADELDPLRGLAASTDPDPIFTMYVIRRSSDGRAVGGLGFFGPPDEEGRIEFGYGLVAGARNQGLATEAVQVALSFAAQHGARIAAADTEVSNVPSQRVLAKAGLRETGRDGSRILYARALSAGS